MKHITDHDIRVCKMKVMYQNQDIAKEAAKRFKKRLGLADSATMSTYICPVCNMFHITRKSRKTTLKLSENHNQVAAINFEAEHWISRKNWGHWRDRNTEEKMKRRSRGMKIKMKL